MPGFTVAHGPPPYAVAFQDWAPATGTAPPTLHDVRAEPRAYPEIEIERVTGWRGGTEIIDNRAGRTFGPGDIAYPARYLGKMRVYEGKVVAKDPFSLVLVQNEMVVGFADQDGEGTMTVTPWPAYADVTPVVWTFTARVIAFDFDPEWTIGDNEMLEWRWVLSLRSSDVKFYTGSPPVGYP